MCMRVSVCVWQRLVERLRPVSCTGVFSYEQACGRMALQDFNKGWRSEADASLPWVLNASTLLFFHSPLHDFCSHPKPYLLTREEAGGVFKEGVKSAQTPLHSALSRGKIRSCYEEAAVRWVYRFALGCLCIHLHMYIFFTFFFTHYTWVLLMLGSITAFWFYFVHTSAKATP